MFLGILSQNGQNIPENPNMHSWCKFGDSSWNPLQVIAQTAKFPRILSQNDLEGQDQ